MNHGPGRTLALNTLWNYFLCLYAPKTSSVGSKSLLLTFRETFHPECIIISSDKPSFAKMNSVTFFKVPRRKRFLKRKNVRSLMIVKTLGCNNSALVSLHMWKFKNSKHTQRPQGTCAHTTYTHLHKHTHIRIQAYKNTYTQATCTVERVLWFHPSVPGSWFLRKSRRDFTLI